MNTTVDRIERAYADVVAVEEVAPGLMRVCTWSDQYVVDARGDGCGCPDKLYNLDDTNMICKHRVAAIVATRDDLPGPWDPAETLDTRDGEARGVMADGGREHPDSFEVVDHDRDNRQAADTRPKAEEMAETAREFGSDNVEILDPADGMRDDRPEPDGGTPEVVDADPSATDLPDDPDIKQDPVDWLPGHFVDEIQGVPTVNRKGYAVIASKYDVSVTATLASDTDFEYAEFTATAATSDGQEYSGFGSAHVARGDGGDREYILNELAETRAMKRAVAWATGVGLTAAAELQGDL